MDRYPNSGKVIQNLDTGPLASVTISIPKGNCRTLDSFIFIIRSHRHDVDVDVDVDIHPDINTLTLFTSYDVNIRSK